MLLSVPTLVHAVKLTGGKKKRQENKLITEPEIVVVIWVLWHRILPATGLHHGNHTHSEMFSVSIALPQPVPREVWGRREPRGFLS